MEIEVGLVAGRRRRGTPSTGQSPVRNGVGKIEGMAWGASKEMKMMMSKAAQVIEECAPEQMPEDSRRRLDACLVWFARWAQRVMPNAVWQQAMQQAMKTLTLGY